MSSYTGIFDKSPDLEAQEIISKKKRIKSSEHIDQIKDSDWIKQSFLILSGAVTEQEKINRIFSRAEYKFQDSSVGGNYVLNPRSQFTRYCDPPIKGRLMNRTDTTVSTSDVNLGIGHYYSEAMDDTNQVIHMRFGVPQFNSLSTFFTGFFDTRAGTAARTGRLDPGFWEGVGRVLGFTFYIVTWPLVLASLVVGFAGNALRFAMDKPSSSFYYFKPTMPNYWLAVSNMVNQIGVNKGLFPEELAATADQYAGSVYRIDQDMMTTLSNMMPDMFSQTGGINVYNMASRGQRLKNQLDLVLNEAFETTNTVDGFVQKIDGSVPSVTPGKRGYLENILNKWFNSNIGKKIDDGKAVDFERSLKVNEDGTPAQPDPTLLNYFAAEYDDGSAFVTMRVNATGAMQESFSNTVVESDIASKFNSTSAAAKSARFSFAEGNAVGGATGAALGAVGDIVKGFVTSGLDAFNIGGILALAGSAFVNIPKHWENSVADLPKASYTINLVSPYGNQLSQMMNIYIPLCCILAGCLPQATGKQSYTSPFLVQLYDRGRQQTRLGMIDSVSVSRGTSNLGFNKEGNALAVEVTFSVVELSSIVAMPVSLKSFVQELNPASNVLDDDNVYSDYLNVLASVGLYDQFYTSAKLKIRLANRMRRYEEFLNPARFAMFTRDKISLLDIFFKGAQRDTGDVQRSGLFGNKAPI